MEGKEFQFEGIVDGHITESASGVKGFGYDSVFIPDGYEKAFAEMDLTTKNQISHRAKAVNQLIDFLRGM
jgi:XTP/dITP diphosphohydrolase